VTPRAETERPETVEARWHVLVHADPVRIHQAIDRTFGLNDRTKPNPYGDGDADGKIEQVLRNTVG
jgi:UDP-N-acetylglucosamine 2-epimerase